ncbi:hypothetical protein V493_04972 [Pseudogymnoascus sp. VKM F-4281 (FW-2241)]|nr:hypothetical protein V493_04972 [Pseudogymnoascus sp. VKM F-4281 (FW-2241)]
MPQATLSSASTTKDAEIEEISSNVTRRHLYSAESRAQMSASLITNLRSHSVDGSLAEIDAKTKDPASFISSDVSIGPFGVLNLNVKALEVDTCDVNQGAEVVDPVGDLQNSQTTPSSMGTFGPILNVGETLQWADLFELDFESILMTHELMNEAGATVPNLTTDNAFAINDDQFMQYADPPPLYDLENPKSTQNGSTGMEPEYSPAILYEVSSVDDAQYLLKHFQDCVVPQMSFMPASSKSPWRTLNLPEAVRTLAEMTYLGTGNVKHASIANLYALLGCSAYHLSANPTVQVGKTVEYWANIVSRCKEHAKTHMQISLRHELKGATKSKYKDQLMAILSMLAFASISGSQKDARCFMVDAERLLRVKGLAKREISRKARLLHHVYTWVRIVGESTSVLHDYPSYGPVVDNICAIYRSNRLGRWEEAIRDSGRPQIGHNARLDDFLRLDPRQSDSDLNIDEAKEHDVGLHDIHLEDSRHFNDTLFQVYGISETWLSLVSQTTRLANILEASRHSKEADAAFFEFLQKRAGRLENIICSSALKTVSDRNGRASAKSRQTSADMPTEAQLPNDYMLRALNAALVILFYRRVRNVNPLILQGHVDHVVQALNQFDQALINHNSQGPGTPWPAFIAGCEAISETHREALLSERSVAKARGGPAEGLF